MRCEKIVELLEKRGLGGAFLSLPATIRYFSGFSGEESYAYISRGRRLILTDSRYTLQAEETGRGFQVLTVSQEKGYGELLKEILSEEGVERLGFEEEAMSYGAVRRLQEKSGLLSEGWVPLGEELAALRMKKDKEELGFLERAEAIGDEAFSYILTKLRPGVTELSIAAELEYFMKSRGAEGTSFSTIVASGRHSAMPHAVPTEKKLEVGDFVTLDFGCKYQGYCSDMTRTVVIGKASSRQREIYDLVLRAQEKALLGIRPGMKGKEVDLLARQVIEEAGFGKYFGHGLGHSVGLEIHEKPALSPKGETVLEAGMIETVEPGIYIPGFGGVRIEDMVALTENGHRNLTKSPKEFMEI